MNKRNILSATIGIAAYNEEKNIVRTLNSILEQKQSIYKIDKIIICSDGSTDSTESLIKNYKSSKAITLLSDEKRKGKSTRVNEILENSNTDICILLDADVLFSSNSALDNLVRPIHENEKIVLTSGSVMPSTPKSIIQKILFTGTILWDKTREKSNGAGAYYCSGGIRAMRKSFYKKFRFPSVTAEDVYPYLYCKYHDLGEFKYVSDAVILYTLPNSVIDYIKQMKRYLGSIPEQKKYFSEKFVENEFYLTSKDKFKVLVTQWLKMPVSVTLYILLLALTRFARLFSKPNNGAVWAEIKSSK